jgi:hypothetical protein
LLFDLKFAGHAEVFSFHLVRKVRKLNYGGDL